MLEGVEWRNDLMRFVFVICSCYHSAVRSWNTNNQGKLSDIKKDFFQDYSEL